LIFFLVSTTGHSLKQIKVEWDIPRVERWIEYCGKHPPLQAMVAAYLGIEAKEPLRLTDDNFGDFLQMIKAEGSGLNG